MAEAGLRFQFPHGPKHQVSPDACKSWSAPRLWQPQCAESAAWDPRLHALAAVQGRDGAQPQAGRPSHVRKGAEVVQ
jgi:hypothetical protein